MSWKTEWKPLAALMGVHDTQQAAVTLATVQLDDPTGYGRIVRDAAGAVQGIVPIVVIGHGPDAGQLGGDCDHGLVQGWGGHWIGSPFGYAQSMPCWS